ncbi:MAG: hypothetical protein K0R34_669 [Herbinix sp.]|nr:hypothetical protein [Herbinix sp.]
MISLTLNEIKTLNKAIDNKCIIGINYSGNLLKEQDEKLFAEAKASLIKKGILKDFYHFTPEGALIYGRLMKYKKAKRYIEIQGIWLGLCDENITIGINQTDYDSYQINTIATDSILQTLEKKYDFIKKTGDESDSQLINHANNRDISNKYLHEAKSRFRLRYIEGNKMRSMLFFYDGKDRFLFDTNEDELYQETADQMNQRITTMLGWEVTNG